jgi:hypothetical protein
MDEYAISSEAMLIEFIREIEDLPNEPRPSDGEIDEGVKESIEDHIEDMGGVLILDDVPLLFPLSVAIEEHVAVMTKAVTGEILELRNPVQYVHAFQSDESSPVVVSFVGGFLFFLICCHYTEEAEA